MQTCHNVSALKLSLHQALPVIYIDDGIVAVEGKKAAKRTRLMVQKATGFEYSGVGG